MEYLILCWISIGTDERTLFITVFLVLEKFRTAERRETEKTLASYNSQCDFCDGSSMMRRPRTI